MKRVTGKKIASGVATTIAVLLLVGGCQTPPDRVMYRNYGQIREKVSTRAEVGTLLGSPEHTIGDTWMYSRPEQHLTVIIDFDANGQVVRKQWVDGANATWEDSADGD